MNGRKILAADVMSQNESTASVRLSEISDSDGVSDWRRLVRGYEGGEVGPKRGWG